jgi:hypothetical protein
MLHRNFNVDVVCGVAILKDQRSVFLWIALAKPLVLLCVLDRLEVFIKFQESLFDGLNNEWLQTHGYIFLVATAAQVTTCTLRRRSVDRDSTGAPLQCGCEWPRSNTTENGYTVAT